VWAAIAVRHFRSVERAHQVGELPLDRHDIVVAEGQGQMGSIESRSSPARPKGRCCPVEAAAGAAVPEAVAILTDPEGPVLHLVSILGG
jgi:hypothetical protein